MIMSDLGVWLYGTKVGHLEGDNRTFDFVASDEGIERFGLGSTMLSLAIPLSTKPPRHLAKRRRNWFAELLPESTFREWLANQAGLAPSDTLGLLAHYGRDVAGAVEVFRDDSNGQQHPTILLPVNDNQIRQYLENPLSAPLGNMPIVGKTSLTGVQPKMLLTRTEQGWAMPTGGAWSTHILKPALPTPRHTSIFDEEYGLRLARRIGLLSYESSIADIDSLPTLVIERYDRNINGRVHQEDLSQILGASGIEKYQEYGGVVSLTRVARTLAEGIGAHILPSLVQHITFALAIGNLDLHTKNMSVLHPPTTPPTLAPAYDCHPLAHRDDSDGRVALSIAGEYRWEALTRNHLEQEFLSWGIRSPLEISDGTLDSLDDALRHEAPDPRAHPHLVPSIKETLSRLRHTSG